MNRKRRITVCRPRAFLASLPRLRFNRGRHLYFTEVSNAPRRLGQGTSQGRCPQGQAGRIYSQEKERQAFSEPQANASHAGSSRILGRSNVVRKVQRTEVAGLPTLVSRLPDDARTNIGKDTNDRFISQIGVKDAIAPDWAKRCSWCVTVGPGNEAPVNEPEDRTPNPTRIYAAARTILAVTMVRRCRGPVGEIPAGDCKALYCGAAGVFARGTKCERGLSAIERAASGQQERSLFQGGCEHAS